MAQQAKWQLVWRRQLEQVEVDESERRLEQRLEGSERPDESGQRSARLEQRTNELAERSEQRLAVAGELERPGESEQLAELVE